MIPASIRRVAPGLALMAVVIALWLPALGASFQFDDWSVIVADPRVASLAAWWNAMPAIRPLLKLVYALGHELGGAPALYRAFNVLLHAISTALVFTLVRRLARRMRQADEAGATWTGACTAVIFGLHPVQTESVTYLSGGSMAFMGCFVLTCLYCTLRAAEAERAWPWSIGAVAALIVALGVRETAVMTPLACTLWWAAQDAGRHRAPRMTLLALGLVTVVALIAGALWTAWPWLVRTSLDTRSPLQNLLVQGDAISWLLGQLVRWDRLNADPAVVPEGGPLGLARTLLLAAILGAAAWQWRSRRWLAFGVLWFFLWLAPTNSVLARLDLVNERQLYLAIIGPAWLVALAVQRLRGHAVAAIAALAMLLAGATALRNGVYADEVVFWQDVTLKSPHNARAANNLGMALAAACQPLAARRAFDTATELDPADPRPRVNAALLERGELPTRDGGC